MPFAPASSPTATRPAPITSQRRLLWWAYAALVLGVGLLLSVAELQHYQARGGPHPWEPFLWELSSVLIVGLLAIALYRWHARLREQGLPLWRLLLGHLLGLSLFVLLHVAGLLLLRASVYALMGLPYQHDKLPTMFAYEGAKDSISYLLFVFISEGLRLANAEQARRHELERLRSELAEARLQRLSDQIQPHFLFNTLNLISSVMYEDVARADQLLCELATLLRQALNAQHSERHTLAQELQLVQPYLTLMQARFGERLQVSLDASPAAQACLLPSLLLIAPIENAITHDVAQHLGPVQLRLCAEVAAGQLRITVDNSGTAPSRDTRAGAIGMANTRERLQASYGAQASVKLESLGGGSRLSLCLPAQMAEATTNLPANPKASLTAADTPR
nr:histidine kinase [uncultured Roseateles sp.]